MMDDPEFDARIGGRLKAGRLALGLSIEALAERAGVSRAMISKIERAEASATAALLGRLCAGLGLPLAALFADDAAPPDPLLRRADQPEWRDPGTGYVRRDVAPKGTGSPVNIVDVLFPAGATVAFERAYAGPTDQHVHLLSGRLRLTLGEEIFDLDAGDCLHMRLDRPLAYHNPGPGPAHYLVILMVETRR